MSILSHWRYRLLLSNMENALNLQRRSTVGVSLGDLMAEYIANGIVNNVKAGKQPDGKRLARLSKRYLAWKIKMGFNPAILYLTNQMMDVREVKGIVVVSRDSMTMFYGIDPWAQQKAEFAIEGSPSKPRRPKRDFYGIDKKTDKALDKAIDFEIDAYIMSHGARRR